MCIARALRPEHTSFKEREGKILVCDIVRFAVPDPCLSDPCDVNADCTREGPLTANFNCTCREPFTVGDGFNCLGQDVFMSLIASCRSVQTYMWLRYSYTVLARPVQIAQLCHLYSVENLLQSKLHTSTVWRTF